VTDGRISQVLNNPGNLTLRKVVEYARALGMKVSIVAYEDGDPDNVSGPINSEIFNMCWKKAGCPNDFFGLAQSSTTLTVREFTLQGTIIYLDERFREAVAGESRYENPAIQRTAKNLDVIETEKCYA